MPRYTAVANTQPPSSRPPLPTRFLLIDISNSYTKLAGADRERLLGGVRRIPTAQLDSENVTALLRRRRFDAIVLSSVVPDKTTAICRGAEAVARCAARGGDERRHGQPARGRQGAFAPRILKVSPRLKLGVGIDYPKPASIGADRLANAAGAVAFYGAPTVVVDFGTAVTFDVISADRKYVGGVIAPGLEAMTHYLYQRTALLPKIKPAEPPSAIGKSTRGAMLAGAVHGYRGLIRQILAEIARELRTSRRMKVIATGGYAELIAAKLPEIDLVHPHLTLEGLRVIATLNA